MATPTNLPASFSTGAVLTAAQMNDLRGAFRILQFVQSADDTTLRSTTSATPADSGLSLTITPQATSNKILLVYVINGYVSTSATGLGVRSVRGSSTVVATDLDNGYGSASGNAFNTMLYAVDSPSTTSATTYKIQYYRNQGTGTAYMNAAGSGTMSRMFAMEISL
jgi:hypothetical protein